MKPRKRLVGRRRWAKVTRFLEKTMETGGSERVRMQAAMRLVDLLTLREQREIAELRRNAPAAPAGDTNPEPGRGAHKTTPEEDERAKNEAQIEEAFQFLKRGATNAA